MVDIELGLNSQVSTAVARLEQKLFTERKIQNVLNIKHSGRKFFTHGNYEPLPFLAFPSAM